ncbi:unnamed protein product [Clonostachys rosea f. rosea IK726]|uniref:Uncharacterized protein n=1 Tax=Clonostachys rosea f. rosea IK726 TaxID=1349383 RepID=A0ACA9TLN9_BIOOC|nr:unnamed protein product [Clonostachys rosea f. rosea IK726]
MASRPINTWFLRGEGSASFHVPPVSQSTPSFHCKQESQSHDTKPSSHPPDIESSKDQKTLYPDTEQWTASDIAPPPEATVIIDSDNESTVSVHAATEIELAASGFKFPKGQLRGKPIELEPLDCDCLRCARALADYKPKDGQRFAPPLCCYKVGSFTGSCTRCVSSHAECLKMPYRHHRLVHRFRKLATDESLRKTREFRILRWRVRQTLESLKNKSKHLKSEEHQNAEEDLRYRRQREAWQDRVQLDIANSLQRIAQSLVRASETRVNRVLDEKEAASVPDFADFGPV